MPDELEVLFTALIRRVVRQELVKAGLIPVGKTLAMAAQDAEPATDDVCGARDPNNPLLICRKPPHRGRHMFRRPPAERPVRPWEPIKEVQLKQGSRTYTITTAHHPVKVQGLGRAGAAGDGWEVIGLERHTQTGEVNVEVIRPGKNQRSRVVKLDRIVYKRPRKG